MLPEAKTPTHHVLKEPLFSQRASSPAESRYSLSTGNPTIEFNKGLGFFVNFMLDSLPSKQGSHAWFISFLVQSTEMRLPSPIQQKVQNALIMDTPIYIFSPLQLKVKNKTKIAFWIYDVEGEIGLIFIWIEDLNQSLIRKVITVYLKNQNKTITLYVCKKSNLYLRHKHIIQNVHIWIVMLP